MHLLIFFWPRAEAVRTHSSAPRRGGAARPTGGAKGSRLGWRSSRLCHHRARITWLFALLRSPPAPFRAPFACLTGQNFPPEVEAESRRFSGKGSRSRVLGETTAVGRPPRVAGSVRAALPCRLPGLPRRPGPRSFFIAGASRLGTPALQALRKNAENLWAEQIPPGADGLRSGVKFRSKSKHALANGEGEAGEKC